MKKVLVGLSGGVDSAVSAYLLKQEGYDVTAGFMINYLAPEGETCPTREDIEVAREVASFLDIPFFTFDYREEYEEKVLNYMYEGYRKGITPNPDIMCNSEIKFKVFLEEALSLGYDMVATGHYARIEKSDSENTSLPAPLLAGEGRKNVVGDYYSTPEYVKGLIKQLRENQTEVEKMLWEILRGRKFHNLKFRRQHPFGRYIADFYCDELKLVIELDGKIHKEKKEYYSVREEVIKKYGVKILRLSNTEIEINLETTLQKIFNFIPPPRRRGLGRGVKSVEELGTWTLKKGIDPLKDQSYFLAGLDQKQLSQSLFPIGYLEKSEVRKIAREIGLPNANRKDSQGICFVGKVDIKKFLEKKIQHKTGLVKDINGNILGEHKGVFYYTIGQRKGLDIGGQKEPIFIIKKDIKNNEIIVGYGDNEEMYGDSLIVDNIHMLSQRIWTFPLQAKAKIRYRQKDQDCTITQEKNTTYKVTFAKQQRAIASGQICAIYIGDELIMSGIIS